MAASLKKTTVPDIIKATVAKVTSTHARLLLQSLARGITSRYNLVLKFTNRSLTAGNDIEINPTPWFIDFEHTPVELVFRMLRATTAHEAFHILWSDFESWVSFQKDPELTAYFHPEVIRAFGNGLEDGRIERLGSNLYEGAQDWMMFTNHAAVKAMTPPKDRTAALIQGFIARAVCGLLPKSYGEAWPDLVAYMDRIESLIVAGRCAATTTDCLGYAKQMLLEARAILPPLRSPAGEYEYVPDDITEGMSGREATEEERSGEKDPRFTPRIVVVPTPADQEDGEKEESSPSASPTAGAGDHATPEDNTSDGEPGDGEKNKPGRHTDDASSRSKHAAAAHPAESADGADGDTEPGESGETGEGAADDESTDGAVEIAGIPDDGGAGDAEESEGGDDAPAGTGKAEREGTDAAAEADSSVDTADEGTLEDKNNTAAGAPEPKSGQDAPDGAPGSDLASGERSDADGGDSTSTEGVDPAEEDAPGGNANGSAVDGEEDDSAAAWADLAGDLSDDSHAHGVSAEGVVDVGDKDMVAVDENYKDGVSGATLHGEVRSLTNEEVEDLISRLGDDALTEESLALGEPPAEPQPALDDGPDYRAMETEMKRSDIHAGVRLAVYDAVPQPALYQDCMSKTARIREELYVKLRPLVVRQRSEQFSGRRSGSLHASRLWRVNAIYDPHVFQNRTMPYDPALAAYLLADASGSMSAKETFGSLDCSRADAVRYTMAALSDVLERLAIVHAASDFDESSTVNHRRLLKFGQKTGRESVVDYGHRLNNRDGYNIRIATAELKRRPERVKVLFVLSDGQPLASDYAGVAAVADTGRAVQEAKAQGIEVVAFYFGPRTVDSLAQERKMFTMANLIVVNDMGRLPLDIAAVLQRIVRRYRVA